MPFDAFDHEGAAPAQNPGVDGVPPDVQSWERRRRGRWVRHEELCGCRASASLFTIPLYAYRVETLAVRLTSAGFVDIAQRPYDPARDSRAYTLYVDTRKPGHSGGVRQTE